MTALTQATAIDDGTPGFGVYIHWPFCAQKCPYCDFNSHVRFGGWDEPRFPPPATRACPHGAPTSGPPPPRGGLGAGGGASPTAAVLQSPPPNLPHQGGGERAAPPTVTSIFFGGGTPSLMQPATVAAILDHIASLWPVSSAAEITLEANPGSVEAGRFAGYRTAGVNRVSIGVQSLRDDDLKRLGRIHSVEEAKAAVALAHKTFDRVSFDLIYARPYQTPADWRTELSEALALAGRHLSLYQLTIEPETPFAALYAKGRLAIPAAEAAHDLYEVTQDLTAAAGLPQYEISNHAAPGEQSRHNLTYWRYGTYAGIGPGAHGRLQTPDALLATETERNPERWLSNVEEAGHGIAATETIPPAAQADEMLLMGLRLSEGVDLDRLARISGLAPSAARLRKLSEQGLIEQIPPLAPPDAETGFDEIRACLGPGLKPATQEKTPRLGRIRATGEGRFILNHLVLELTSGLETAPQDQ